MIIVKGRHISKRDYATIHRKLRRKLERQAFNNFFQCKNCHGHANLEIHFTKYDPVDYENSANYEIQCSACHHKVPRNIFLSKRFE